MSVQVTSEHIFFNILLFLKVTLCASTTSHCLEGKYFLFYCASAMHVLFFPSTKGWTLNPLRRDLQLLPEFAAKQFGWHHFCVARASMSPYSASHPFPFLALTHYKMNVCCFSSIQRWKFAALILKGMFCCIAFSSQHY